MANLPQLLSSSFDFWYDYCMPSPLGMSPKEYGQMIARRRKRSGKKKGAKK